MRIYFTVDERNRVFPCCDYQPDIVPSEDWRDGEMTGDAYDENSIPLWKYVGGVIVARTAQEIADDKAHLPVPEPTENERLRADVDYLLMITEEM